MRWIGGQIGAKNRELIRMPDDKVVVIDGGHGGTDYNVLACQDTKLDLLR